MGQAPLWIVVVIAIEVLTSGRVPATDAAWIILTAGITASLVAFGLAVRVAHAIGVPVQRLREAARLTAVQGREHSAVLSYGADLAEIATALSGDGPVTPPNPPFLFVAVDTETTGLDTGADAIVSIGAVRLTAPPDDGEAKFHTLINPARPIPSSATRIHGLGDQDVATAPPLAAALPDFLAFIDRHPLVMHNAQFDLAFLNRGLRAAGLPAIPRDRVFDTLAIARTLFPTWEEHTLDHLAARLGVPIEARHSALGDAAITATAFTRLLTILRHHDAPTSDALRRLDPVTSSQQTVHAVRTGLGLV
ncbi:MAG: 3'-5' exonuclease [Chloroflexota bacterium]